MAAGLSQEDFAAWLAEQDEWVLDEITRDEWWWTRRPEQIAPPGEWFIWIIMSGRGWGKTRTGSEWIVDQALAYPVDLAGQSTQWLVIGQTLSDTRDLCIEGPSGVEAVLRRRGIAYHYTKAPKPRIKLLEHGQIIFFEGVDDEDTARGYNAAGAWLDELAKWRYTNKVWLEGIMPSVRANLPNGGKPKVIVTTTPKPIKLLKDWQKRARAGDASIQITTGSTYENFANLSPHTIAEFRKEYEGTTVGRQELYGELLEDVDGALWNHQMIEKGRVKPADIPKLKMTVVGMDPPGTGTADECGIVVVGRGVDQEDYVLGDYSAKMVGRTAARKAWQAFAEHDATYLVCEDNFGKQWLQQVLVDAYREMQAEGVFAPGGGAPLKMITALHGKKLRAQPTAMRYEQVRVHHASNGLYDLEDQMCSWVPEEDLDSPDRIDALVHAQAFLRSREKGRASLGVAGSTGGPATLPVGNPYG